MVRGAEELHASAVGSRAGVACSGVTSSPLIFFGTALVSCPRPRFAHGGPLGVSARVCFLFLIHLALDITRHDFVATRRRRMITTLASRTPDLVRPPPFLPFLRCYIFFWVGCGAFVYVFFLELNGALGGRYTRRETAMYGPASYLAFLQGQRGLRGNGYLAYL